MEDNTINMTMTLTLSITEEHISKLANLLNTTLKDFIKEPEVAVSTIVEDVWLKISGIGRSTFRKKDLTPTLQHRYDSSEIQKGLNFLVLAGKLVKIKDPTQEKGRGAAKSPMYRIVGFRKLNPKNLNKPVDNI